MQGIWKHFFLGRRWINNQRKSNFVWYNTPHWKIISLFCCPQRSLKSHLNNRIYQHCGVKTSTVTPSFCYIFNISLSCNINIPSFIGNLWWVLLLGNHLKGNIIWACSVGPVTSLSVAFISFAKKVAIDFCQFFPQLLRILYSLNL